MCDGTASTNRASASGSTTVEVGLFGLQTKISRVRSVTAASIASRSKVWSVSGTWTAVAPASADLQRVDLEAAPAEQHLVADRGGDLDELLAQADRSATDGDVLGREVPRRRAWPGLP